MSIAEHNSTAATPGSRIHSDILQLLRIFAISMAALYFELLVIRYIGTELRIFAYLKNIT